MIDTCKNKTFMYILIYVTFRRFIQLLLEFYIYLITFFSQISGDKVKKESKIKNESIRLINRRRL